MNPKTTILIADDHPVFRKGLVQVIQSDPAFVVVGEAGDGDVAWQLITTGKPDLVILDIAMPRRSGIEVAREFRRRRMPGELIFLTAYKDPEMFDEALNLEVKGYVLKDSAGDDILDALRAVAMGESYVSPTLSGLLLGRRQSAQKLRAVQPGLNDLTPSERRILKLITQDRTSKEIADDLGISPRTVDNHRANIALKLNLHGTHSLLKFAFDNKALL